jgi:MFS family permease
MPSFRDMIHGSWITGPWRAVSVLGVTQIIAWGTIFYSPVLIAPLIAREHGWSLSFAMGGLSLGLLIAGLVAPFVGRSIDRHGGHVVMAIGALVSAAGLLGLAAVQDRTTYLLAWIVTGAGLGASLYDPAFATLGRIFGAAARRPITVLTLAGGFASTAGWPATHLLIGAAGWRGTYLVYALLMAAVCAPLYAFALPRTRAAAASAPKDQTGTMKPTAPLLPSNGVAFLLVTAAFTAYAFVPSALAAHLLAIFGRTGGRDRRAVRPGAGRGAGDGARLRPRHPPAAGRARGDRAAACGFRAAGAVRDFAAERRGLRDDVRRRERPRHHHARRAAARAVWR